jgi:peptidoglycan/xylan/chitin deacetylase (PgdA/CDA1 family)
VSDRIAESVEQRRWPAIVLLGLLFSTAAVAADPNSGELQLAVTVDDLPGPNLGIERLEAMTGQLLEGLKAHGVPAVGFVNEKDLYHPGEVDRRIGILEAWLEAGFELGNHTFSHPSLHRTPLAEFQEDVVRGETVTRMLLEQRGRRLRYFRHPYLRTGLSLEVRQEFGAFLEARGYMVAPVTVWNWDWIFAAAYRKAQADADRQSKDRIVEAYLNFTQVQFDFWERAAQQVASRPIRQILLLHAYELNGDCIDRLLSSIEERGYQFITLDDALKDPVYQRPGRDPSGAGIPWLRRWAHGAGVEINWGQEPRPPAFVQKEYDAARLPTKDWGERGVGDLFDLAFGEQKAGNREKAIELYEQLLKISPDHRQGNFNLAYAYVEGTDKEELSRSVNLFLKTLEIDPAYTECLHWLASAHRKLGNKDEAVKYDRLYLEQRSNHTLKRE